MKIQLLDTLRERHWDKSFMKVSKEVDEFFLSVPDNRNNLINQFDSTLALYNYYVSQLSKSKSKFCDDELTLASKAIKKLVLFFITNSAAIIINSGFVSDSFNKKPINEYSLISKNGLLDEVLKSLEWDSREKILVDLYLNFFKILHDPCDKKVFEEYKNYIDININVVDKTELMFHFNHLMVLYKHFLDTTGNVEFLIRLASLREMILFEGLYVSNFNHEYLHLDLRNLILDFLNLKWPDRLINLIPYSAKLSKKYQEPFVNYIQANYYFLMNEFDQAMHSALQVGSVEKRLLIDMDIMRVKIYFLSSEFINCIDKINTLKKYFSEFKIMRPDVIEKYKCFLKVIQKSIQFIENKDYQSLEYFASLVKEKESLIFKEWFLENIAMIVEERKIILYKV